MPVGQELADENAQPRKEEGSIIIVVATDAPLLPHQLKRLARRAALGVARTGTVTHDNSGEIFVAFSTANAGACNAEKLTALMMLPNASQNDLFAAAVEATEEAIVNALIAAETMTGTDGKPCEALPHEKLREVMKKYNRLAPARK